MVVHVLDNRVLFSRKIITVGRVLISNMSYEKAISELNNSIKVTCFPKSEDPSHLKRHRFGLSLRFTNAIGITSHHLDNLRVIHVTGSKGKGSVCSMVEHSLRASGFRTGFMSSPHLVNVEERIRINGKTIDRSYFAKLFWDVYHSLKIYTEAEKLSPPTYLSYLFVMACKAFVEEKVDVAIIEVGIGGRYDHTNIFEKPAITVVTSLALEHTEILGNTLSEIAWRKAGIFKPGSIAVISAEQPDEALEVFIKESELVGCPLYIAPTLKDLMNSMNENINTSNSFDKSTFNQLNQNHIQSLNWGLSLTVTNLWLRLYEKKDYASTKTGLQPKFPIELDCKYLSFISQFLWPGRLHKLSRGNVIYFLDGAHTIESIKYSVEWFQKESCALSSTQAFSTTRILIFTVIGPRDPEPLLKWMKCYVKPKFDLVVFANPHDNRLSALPNKRSLDELCYKIWCDLDKKYEDLDPGRTLAIHIQCLTEFIHNLHQLKYYSRTYLQKLYDSHESNENMNNNCVVLRNYSDLRASCHVFVTGSLYIVGRILKEINEPLK